MNTEKVDPPIWHSPAWLTAIVGLVSIFFTVPDVVGNYLSKKQDIALSEKKIQLAQINNEDLEKINHFKSLVTVLQQKEKDKLITLRFIAQTSGDKSISDWAKKELDLQENSKEELNSNTFPAVRP